MIIYLAIFLGCIIGAIVGINAPVISYTYSSYLSIAIIAALDTVFGGIASVVKKNFDLKIFLSGFFGNSILAIALTYLGNKLNVDIYLAAIIVFVGGNKQSFEAYLKTGFVCVDVNYRYEADDLVSSIVDLKSAINGAKSLNIKGFSATGHIHKRCVNTIKEHQSYAWDNKAIEQGAKERPLKVNDHSCDALRYFISTVIRARRIANA